MLSWSLSLKYQLARCHGLSNWSVLFTYQWEAVKTCQRGPLHWRTKYYVMMILQHGARCWNWLLKSVNFFCVLCGTFLRRLRWCRKSLVSFRYQLWRLCNVLSWSDSLRYQLVSFYDLSNRSVLFKYQWDVSKMSQISPSHWRTNCNIMMTSQHVSRRSYLYET